MFVCSLGDFVMHFNAKVNGKMPHVLRLRLEKGIQSGLWLVKIAIGSDRKNQHRDQERNPTSTKGRSRWKWSSENYLLIAEVGIQKPFSTRTTFGGCRIASSIRRLSKIFRYYCHIGLLVLNSHLTTVFKQSGASDFVASVDK